MSRLDRVRHLSLGQPWFVVAVFAAVFLFGTFHFFTAHRKGSQKPQIVVGVDGRYHWAYLTSIALDLDLDFKNQYADPESGNYYGYTPTDTGRLANPFPIGPALAWMPFFAVAHPIAKIAGVPNADKGSSVLEQQITLFGSYLYAIATMLIVYAACRRRFSPGASLVGALVAFLCGPLLHYALNQPHYAHVPSAFFVALLLYVWDGGRGQERSLRSWLVLGALLGAAMLMRAQNLVFAAPLVGEAVVRLYRSRDPRTLVAPLAGAALAVVVFFPQMLAWKVIYGSWAGVPQGPGYMQWAQPMWSETLFSSRNGLFPYAPLWLVGFLGWIALARRDRNLVITFVVCLVLALYINGASSDWSGGGAMGGRRYDGFLLPVGLGIAVLVEWILLYSERHPRRVAGAALVPFLLVGWRCQYRLGEEFRLERLAPSAAKDTVALYGNVLERELRPLFAQGNPLSWPGAWAFALRHGVPASRYDEVVGAYFLTDFSVESFRKRADKLKDELKFGAPNHAKFLVGGWADGGKAIGPRQGVLVPMNQPDGAKLTLVGKASLDATLRVRWNGREVASAENRAGQPVALDVALTPEQIDRGINRLELVHDGVGAGQEAASYESLRMTQVLPPR